MSFNVVDIFLNKKWDYYANRSLPNGILLTMQRNEWCYVGCGWAKEGRHRRIHSVWFHLHESLEKTNLCHVWWPKDQCFPRLGWGSWDCLGRGTKNFWGTELSFLLIVVVGTWMCKLKIHRNACFTREHFSLCTL